MAMELQGLFAVRLDSGNKRDQEGQFGDNHSYNLLIILSEVRPAGSNK